jgi:hypothetical protein
LYSWKVILIGTALGTAVIGTIVQLSSSSFERAGGSAIATPGMVARQPISAVTDPITSSRKTHDSSETSDREYGWGPFRLVDW